MLRQEKSLFSYLSSHIVLMRANLQKREIITDPAMREKIPHGPK